MDPEEPYAADARRLLGRLPRDAGLDESTISRNEARLGVRLPPALRGYYRRLGNLGVLNDAHNRLLAPADWFIDDRRLVFMVENQAVVYWGVEATVDPADDPPVDQGVNRPTPPLDWHPECDRTSTFLSVMLHWQAAAGGFAWLGMAAQTGPAAANALAASWERVGGFGALDAFCRPGQAACRFTDGSGGLYVGARTGATFRALAREWRTLGVRLEEL